MEYKLLKTKRYEALIIKGNTIVARCCREVSKHNWYVLTVTKKSRVLAAIGNHSSAEDALDAYVKYKEYLSNRKVK